MSLTVGIVGLPNAGKSTLFNAMTQAGAAVGQLSLHHHRTQHRRRARFPTRDSTGSRRSSSRPKVIPATVTFTDIAGLVRGASRGEGLGNRFLGHIREADATALVVRAFDDPDVTHVEGGVDPVRDIDVLELELQLADLETITKRLERTEKTSRLQKEKEPEMIALLRRVAGAPRPGQIGADDGAQSGGAGRCCGSSGCSPAKPLMVIVNVAESAAGAPVPAEIVESRATRRAAMRSPSRRASRTTSPSSTPPTARHSCTTSASRSPVCIASRAAPTGCSGSSPSSPRATPRCAPGIFARARPRSTLRRASTRDIARGFIRAEVTDAEELLDAGSYAVLRERGKQRLEGRDYVMRDGDVIHVRFNV